MEAGVYAEQLAKALEQQCGTGEQHERQHHLRGNQDAAHPVRCAAGRARSAFVAKRLAGRKRRRRLANGTMPSSRPSARTRVAVYPTAAKSRRSD
jgi:hypothetical protein